MIKLIFYTNFSFFCNWNSKRVHICNETVIFLWISNIAKSPNYHHYIGGTARSRSSLKDNQQAWEEQTVIYKQLKNHLLITRKYRKWWLTMMLARIKKMAVFLVTCGCSSVKHESNKKLKCWRCMKKLRHCKLPLTQAFTGRYSHHAISSQLWKALDYHKVVMHLYTLNPKIWESRSPVTHSGW